MLAKPRNKEERDALAQHLAKMAASATVSEDALAQVNALSTPAVPAAVVQPATAHHPPTASSDQKQPTTRPKATLAPAATLLQHDREKIELKGHVDATEVASSPAVAAEAVRATASAAASAPQSRPLVSPRVATFYYPWYGTPAVDGKWAHWDHPQIEHWYRRHSIGLVWFLPLILQSFELGSLVGAGTRSSATVSRTVRRPGVSRPDLSVPISTQKADRTPLAILVWWQRTCGRCDKLALVS